MTCTKCGGMVIDDFGEHRCLTCGCRPQAAPVREPEPDEPLKMTAAGQLGFSRQKRSADQVMQLVMSEVRAHRKKPKEDDDMARETSETCTWPAGCEEAHAEGSRYCAHHRDVKKRSNENQKRKREGLPPLPATGTRGRKRTVAVQQDTEGVPAPPAQPKKDAATVHLVTRQPASDKYTLTHVSEVPWTDWKASLLAQLADAEEKLRAKLTNLEAAKSSIEAL